MGSSHILEGITTYIPSLFHDTEDNKLNILYVKFNFMKWCQKHASKYKFFYLKEIKYACRSKNIFYIMVFTTTGNMIFNNAIKLWITV